MKSSPKALAVILATSLLLGVVACDGDNNKNADKTSDSSKTSEQTEVVEDSSDTPADSSQEESDGSESSDPSGNDSEEGNQEGGIWAKYDEPIQISTALVENPGIIFRDGDDYDNNPWYREYKERFNIEVVNEWVVASDYSTRINLSIADQDIPDVFYVSYDQFRQLQEADMIWDLTETYENYASDTIKGFMEEEDQIFETAKVDDRIYAMPQLYYGIIDQIPQMWIRRDWMSESSVESFETIEAFEDLVREFMKTHDTYGIAENRTLQSFNLMARTFGAYPNLWVENDEGKIVHGSTLPEMKTALERYAQWYQDGIVSPGFATADYNAMTEEIANGSVGAVPFTQWFGCSNGATLENFGPEAIFDCYPLPSATGEAVKHPVGFPNYGYIVVSKDCEHPDAVMKLLNLYAYLSDEAYKTEDVEYVNQFFDGAYSNLAYGLRIIDPMTDYKQYEATRQALKDYEAGKEVDLTLLGHGASKFKTIVNFIEKQNPADFGTFAQQGNGDFAAYYVAKEALDNDHYFQNKLWGAPTDTISSMGETLSDIFVEGFTSIILGDAPIDSFDSLVEEWYQTGGEQATEEVNAVYGN